MHEPTFIEHINSMIKKIGNRKEKNNLFFKLIEKEIPLKKLMGEEIEVDNIREIYIEMKPLIIRGKINDDNNFLHIIKKYRYINTPLNTPFDFRGEHWIKILDILKNVKYIKIFQESEEFSQNDISFFSKITSKNFVFIDLSNSTFSGMISDFQDFKSLKHLNISGTKILTDSFKRFPDSIINFSPNQEMKNMINSLGKEIEANFKLKIEVIEAMNKELKWEVIENFQTFIKLVHEVARRNYRDNIINGDTVFKGTTFNLDHTPYVEDFFDEQEIKKLKLLDHFED